MADVLDLSVRQLIASTEVGIRMVREVGAMGSVAFSSPPVGGASYLVDDPRVALREAALALVVRQVAVLLRGLPLERVAAALRDDAPDAAVAALLADVALEQSAARREDPIALAVQRGTRRKRELLERAGGAFSTADVAERLGISRQAIEKRRQAGSLLGVRTAGGEWVYPVAQFASDGAPLAGLSDVIGAFQIESPWLQLEHLLVEDAMLSSRAVSGTIGSDAPRSALTALRESGEAAVAAIRLSLQQVGDVGA